MTSTPSLRTPLLYTRDPRVHIIKTVSVELNLAALVTAFQLFTLNYPK